jgi:hypothetical protein
VDEHQDNKKPRIDLESEVGLSRRDMLRRSAIVGGALLWAAPVVQSVGMRAAGAQPAPTYGPSPGSCAACYCYTLRPDSPYLAKSAGIENGLPAPPPNAQATGLFTADDCENWCKWQSGYDESNGAPEGPFAVSQYCSGTPTETALCDAPPSLGIVPANLNILPGTVSCPP